MSSARGLAHESVRDGHQQPSAVAASSIGVHTAAMRQPHQRLRARSTISRDGAPPIRVDQADTAGVVVRCLALMCHLTLLAGVS